MPYIIRTGLDGQDTRYHSRRAVATLDEARDHITDLFPFPAHGHKTTERVGNDLSAMSESGGTIGPLPDGTVIEVTHAPVSDPAMHAGWVEIYNRNHAQGS